MVRIIRSRPLCHRLPLSCGQTFQVRRLTQPEFHSVQLQGLLARVREGDLAARDELLRVVCQRLERLARKMLRQFPNVGRWADTNDVLQNALLRLLRSLQAIQPASTREFFGLAAAHIRRELLDMARHYDGPLGVGARHESQVIDAAAVPGESDLPGDADLEKWCAFHREVEQLPVEEREVVGLIFYHGWSQQDVAALFQVTTRTVQRRWQSALRKLRKLLTEPMSET